MEKEKFDLGRLDSGYLAERSGTALDGETADRLDLWCEDMVKAMAPDPADSVSMAKRTASLWRELGIIWPADGSGGIRGVQGEMLRAVMESKGFTVGGKQFEAGFSAAMDGASGPNGYRNIYKAIAGGISGDGATRDGYGRQLHENGRPEGMWHLPPGGYANAMKRDNERIRTELELDGRPDRDLTDTSGIEPDDKGPARLPERAPDPAASTAKKPSAWSRLKAVLGMDRDDGRDAGKDGPEF